MLDSLYTEALRKKGSIQGDIEELIDKEIDINKYWTTASLPPRDENFTLAAGDGSFNKKKFLSFYLYAVDAVALIYSPDEKLKNVESVELDIIGHQSFVDERLRNLMSIFEIKTALKAFKTEKIDYYMDDGSILGDLIRPIPIEKSITRDDRKEIANRLLNHIKTEDDISSFNFKDEFKDLFEDKDERSLLTYLETIEHLIALKNLLSFKDSIIAISKTSTSDDLFHNPYVPDMAILDKMTRHEGYSKPIYKKVDSEAKREFPVYNNFFREMWFTTFFTRLEDNKNIIKVELPYYADEERIKDIISIIKSNSTDGYPYLLKKAHNDVVIKNTDIENLSNILEILDKSGREMLK